MNYKKIYRAAFDYHARWEQPPTTDDDWMRCSNDMCNIANEHNNDPFLCDLLTAIYGEIERLANNERKVNP